MRYQPTSKPISTEDEARVGHQTVKPIVIPWNGKYAGSFVAFNVFFV